MKLNELNVGERFFVLIKGEPGSGKSIAAASFAKRGPMFFFDFDGKIAAVLDFYKKKHLEIVNNIEYETFDDYNTAADRLDDFIKNGHPYDGGIVWDTLTTSVDRIFTQIEDIKGGSHKTIGGISVGEIEDYNAENAALTRLIQKTKFKLSGNFFLLAHVVKTEEKDIKTKSITYSRSLLTGGKKVAAKIPAYFNEVWHMQVDAGGEGFGDTKYKLLTQHTGVDFARTSMGLSPSLDVTSPKLAYDEIMKDLTAERFGA